MAAIIQSYPLHVDVDPAEALFNDWQVAVAYRQRMYEEVLAFPGNAYWQACYISARDHANYLCDQLDNMRAEPVESNEYDTEIDI